MASTLVDDVRQFRFELDSRFQMLYDSARRQHPQHVRLTLTEKVLALDPGETTGWATYEPLESAVYISQQVTKEIGPSGNWLRKSIDLHSFDHIRAEDYRVYEWKAQDHSWSPIHTAQWIGAIRLIAYETDTPLSFMMAQQAKQFWTDAKLDMFGMNPKGLKHGRDALRHLLYYLLFPNSGS
jgi:hypothetical protein